MFRSAVRVAAVLCPCVALALASWTLAQPPKVKVIEDEAKTEVRVKEKPAVDPAKGGVEVRTKKKELRAHHHFAPHRASEVMGMTVQGMKGAEVGVVKDLVLDCSSGRIKYVVVSFSSFEGFDEKLFAVPWEVFECKAGPDGHDHVLIVEVTEQQLVKAPYFSATEWPNFSEVKWYETNDAYFHKHFKVRAGSADGRRAVHEDGREDREIRREDGDRSPRDVDDSPSDDDTSKKDPAESPRKDKEKKDDENKDDENKDDESKKDESKKDDN